MWEACLTLLALGSGQCSEDRASWIEDFEGLMICAMTEPGTGIGNKAIISTKQQPHTEHGIVHESSNHTWKNMAQVNYRK